MWLSGLMSQQGKLAECKGIMLIYGKISGFSFLKKLLSAWRKPENCFWEACQQTHSQSIVLGLWCLQCSLWLSLAPAAVPQPWPRLGHKSAKSQSAQNTQLKFSIVGCLLDTRQFSHPVPQLHHVLVCLFIPLPSLFWSLACWDHDHFSFLFGIYNISSSPQDVCMKPMDTQTDSALFLFMQ